MATLRSVLETANGLYHEPGTGASFQGRDLLASLPDEALDAPVRIRKVRAGIYQLEVQTPGNGRYDLYSRRRALRTEH